jgi:hypothetical protein
MRARLSTLAALAAALLLPASSALAEILVQGDVLEFSVPKGARSGVDRVRRLVRFQDELRLKLPAPDLDSPLGNLLISNLRRGIVQGLRFSVPASRAFAVVASYRCDMQEWGAEFPFVCHTVLAVLDPSGALLGSTEGDFFEIEAHARGPYFMAWVDTCCDGPVRATLFSLDGRRVCELPDHRDEGWKTKQRLRCQANPDQWIEVDLLTPTRRP